MEAHRWKPFTSVTRKLRSLLHRDPPVDQPPIRDYVEVTTADAIAHLCLPTGDEQIDYLHVILIDLIQKGLVQAVRVDDDPQLRYIATDAGKKYVEDHLGVMVDKFLQGMFGDTYDH